MKRMGETTARKAQAYAFARSLGSLVEPVV